ncbi:MAG: DUF4198 domain-containing protein [Bacteroidales bacterium]|nr:DUF4198 domain-containing protein [Bacteroidales bacterium]
MKKVTLLLLSSFVLFTSHELFLKSDSYFLNTNEESELFLFNGTFDLSENTITRDRIVNAKIIGPEYKFVPTEKDYYDNDNITCLKFKTGNEGTYVAGISTLPNIIELTAEEFNEYLLHEELLDVLAHRKKNELTNLSAREKYSKHVKALFQVSGKRTNNFNTVLGYPVEFIPVNNPYDLSKGDKLSLRLLKEGKPLTNQMVHFSNRFNSENHSPVEKSTRTNKNGILTIELDQVGRWYVATIDMVESDEENIDYVSNWATLTFEIR